MIQIHYYPAICRVVIRGHADFAAAGSDPVCAGVSVLTYTLASNVLGEAGAVCRLQKGQAVVACRPGKRQRRKFETVCRGFRLLATHYPEHVSFREQGKEERLWKF